MRELGVISNGYHRNGWAFPVFSSRRNRLAVTHAHCPGRDPCPVIALSAAACASTSVRPDDSSKSGTSAKVAPPAPLAGLTPDQIVQKALDNLLAATSVRISGNVPSQGENVSFDLTDGIEQSCSGTFAVTPSASSGNAARPVAAAIIEAGGTMYVKYATSYLESLHPTASEFAQFNGKYISVAPSKLEGLAEVCDLPGLVSTLDQQEGGFVAAGTATIDGQPALAFKQPGGTPRTSSTSSTMPSRRSLASRNWPTRTITSTSATWTRLSRSRRRRPARSSTVARSGSDAVGGRLRMRRPVALREASSRTM